MPAEPLPGTAAYQRLYGVKPGVIGYDGEFTPIKDPFVESLEAQAATERQYISALQNQMERASDLAQKQWQHEMDLQDNAASRSFQTLTTQKRNLLAALSEKDNLLPMIVLGGVLYFYVFKKGKL